jgi:hypothetical protein
MKYSILFFALFFSIQVSAQKTISGRVTKAGGGILPGVKVSAKDAPMIFTLSDEKGNYKIEIPQEVTSLVFSYSGMATKTVKIKDFIAINVRLVPAKYRTFRYGAGLAFGTSHFSVINEISPEQIDTTTIPLTPIALHADLYYRFHKSFEIQAVIEDGLNYTKIQTDSITETGDTIQVPKTTGVNRASVSVMLNYNFKLSKDGNHSAFAGFGPQYQHLSFLKTNTVGARFQAGVNINNYGFTTRLYLAIDVASGKFNENNVYVPGLPYKYMSSRFGLTFIF